MRIANLIVDPPLALGPMSGITDAAFRLLCHEAGAGLVYSGMLSANALHFSSGRTEELMDFRPDEGPVCAQVFGAEPEIVAAAAVEVARRGADLVDINMGCAVPKVLKARSGATLMADPARAEAMVRAVVRAVRIPVAVKLRRGWRDRGEGVVELARRCERAGAAMLAIHPRWAGQQFRGEAEWAVIGEVKRAVSLPVFGNGDVRSGADAVRLVNETGCDGVMIARGALGNPWLFAEAAAALRGEPPPPLPTIEQRLAVARRHIALVLAERGEEVGSREMRKHLSWYLHGLPGARALRELANRAASREDLLGVLEMAAREAGVRGESAPVGEGG